MISVENFSSVQYHKQGQREWNVLTGAHSIIDISRQSDQSAESENTAVITEQVHSYGFEDSLSNSVHEVRLNEIDRGCENVADVDEALAASFKQLLKLYAMYSNVGVPVPATGTGQVPDMSPRVVVSGGLQQYLIRNRDKLREYAQQPMRGNGSLTTTFHDLPDSLQLTIFSYLDLKTLCSISGVCRHWNIISLDEVLWKQRLSRDMVQWSVIGHMTNPYMYQECQSDLMTKEIYLRCSPEVNDLVHRQSMGFHTLSSVLRSLWPKRTVKVAMFGPGLESSTSSITRRILEDTSGVFKTTGMFPGSFEGVGSGFTMKMNNSVQFNLVTLYTSTRKERECATGLSRLQVNKLLVPIEVEQPGEEIGSDGEDGEAAAATTIEYVPTEGVKQLCRTLDACVFVVDASVDEQELSSAQAELLAMVNSQWTEASVPLLVLSCVQSADTTRLPCIEVVRHLNLGQLSRPWQVHDCVVDQLETVSTALQWVVENARRR